MEKWNTILKLTKETNRTLDLYKSCDWICTDFGAFLNGPEELILVLQPLQTHPCGEAFGVIPSGLACYMVKNSELKKYFTIQEGRSYMEEQRKFS